MARRKTTKRRRRKPRRLQRGGKFISTLHRLKKLRPRQRNQAIQLANNKFIRDFVSGVKQLRNARLKPSMRTRLKRQAKNLRKFVNSKTSIGTKRKMLVQRGGFAPLLLAALPALGSILGGVISRV